MFEASSDKDMREDLRFGILLTNIARMLGVKDRNLPEPLEWFGIKKEQPSIATLLKKKVAEKKAFNG